MLKLFIQRMEDRVILQLKKRELRGKLMLNSTGRAEEEEEEMKEEEETGGEEEEMWGEEEMGGEITKVEEEMGEMEVGVDVVEKEILMIKVIRWRTTRQHLMHKI